MAVNSGAGDAASVSYPFVSYSSASGSAITQELLFCVLGRVNLPKRIAVWTKKEIARQCAFRADNRAGYVILLSYRRGTTGCSREGRCDYEKYGDKVSAR